MKKNLAQSNKFSRTVTLITVIILCSLALYFVFFKSSASGAFISIVSFALFWENTFKVKAYPEERMGVFEKYIYALIMPINLVTIIMALYIALT
jgi:hypothetical protein